MSISGNNGQFWLPQPSSVDDRLTMKVEYGPGDQEQILNSITVDLVSMGRTYQEGCNFGFWDHGRIQRATMTREAVTIREDQEPGRFLREIRRAMSVGQNVVESEEECQG